MDLLQDGSELAARKLGMDLLAGEPMGVGPVAFAMVVVDYPNIARKMLASGDMKHLKGVGFVATSDPWYHEPKQRVMRRCIIDVIHNHMAGYSKEALMKILQRREDNIDVQYTDALLVRMIAEGVLNIVDGTEFVLTAMINPDGTTPKLDTAASTSQESFAEQPAKVYRLTATHWLKDTAR
jgi:hypothetical protein